jgi:hypothetical protein
MEMTTNFADEAVRNCNTKKPRNAKDSGGFARVEP